MWNSDTNRPLHRIPTLLPLEFLVFLPELPNSESRFFGFWGGCDMRMAPKLCSLRLIFVLTCVPAAPTVVSSLSPRALFSPRGTRVQNEKTRIMRAQSSPRKADVTIPQTRPLSNDGSLSVRRRDRLYVRAQPPGDLRGDKWTKLVVCILIDFIGMSSYTVPALGEAADVGWAPVSALLIQYLFGNGLITGVALVEELLPGTDIFPTATIAWILENSEAGEKVIRVAEKVPSDRPRNLASQSKKSKPDPSDNDFIDV
ncbi:hypothetical protein AAMO2058_001349500 [Amorphochlora amoebiformis]